jgi:hypothetical protein
MSLPRNLSADVARGLTPVSHAAVSEIAEKVCGVAGTLLLLSERTSAQGLAGATFLVLAIALISLRPRRPKRVAARVRSQAGVLIHQAKQTSRKSIQGQEFAFLAVRNASIVLKRSKI